MKESALRYSMAREMRAIERAMEKEKFVNRVALGGEVYRLTQRDCSDFIHGSPAARLKFAQETGLIPNDQVNYDRKRRK
jgi:hypothetical protein